MVINTECMFEKQLQKQYAQKQFCYKHRIINMVLMGRIIVKMTHALRYYVARSAY